MRLYKLESIKDNEPIIIPIHDTLAHFIAYIKDTTLSKKIEKIWEENNALKLVPLYIDEQWIIPINCSKANNYEKLKKQFQGIAHNWNPTWGSIINIDLQHSDSNQADAILNGLVTGTYQIAKYKSSSLPEAKLESIGVMSDAVNADGLESIGDIAETQMQIMDLMNGPANISNIENVISWAQTSGSTYNYNVRVIDTQELEELGMGSLLAVGRAAVTKSHMLVMQYKHPAATGKKVALVGKGVTFDTGGLSIKGANNMHYMKSDMGGAAAVLGTLEIVAKSQLKKHLIGVIPLAENVIANNAVIPGDIITSYSGKTIEIIDTDAEGRLILADALYYAQEQFAPDIMIDLATLTGSAVRTFGYHCGALFSHNDDLKDKLQSIGSSFGERLWPLPLWEEYQEHLHSDIADLRNLGTMPLAGAITAAKFLENFTNEHPCWAHLDIAGVAFGNTAISKQKAGTAYGVKLLYEFVKAS